MLGVTAIKDFVADSSFIAKEDMTIGQNMVLKKGSQYNKPINMSGYYSLQGMLTYGMPVDFLRSNLNLSGAVNYSNIPNIYDGIKNTTRELTFVPKLILSSNISEDLDFTVSYSAGINNAYNTLSDASDNA